MPEIALLTQDTIDKIAAGEVVERPSSVVKELVENAVDAGATAVTIETKEGGISLIRITDNGCGMRQDQVRIAFLRHSTSKIRKIEDLASVTSLGFRGEALSSIAAVSRVELITKTREELTGTRYLIEGSKEVSLEEIGAPDGTTFLIKDLFYNTPARRKFLKTAHTEGNYISEIVEKLALSHPEISFKYIQNNQTKLHTSGNGNRRDLIYHIFGREINAALMEINFESEFFTVSGYIGKPVITRGNRNYENYFINGRYIRSSLLSKAIEDAYKNYLMQHQYPFTVLYFTFRDGTLDVNVHPSKMELRFDHNQEVYTALYEGLYGVLSHKEMIPVVPVKEEKSEKDDRKENRIPDGQKTTPRNPEPFETRRLNDIRRAAAQDSPYEVKYPDRRRPTQYERTAQQRTSSYVNQPSPIVQPSDGIKPYCDDQPSAGSQPYSGNQSAAGSQPFAGRNPSGNPDKLQKPEVILLGQKTPGTSTSGTVTAGAADLLFGSGPSKPFSPFPEGEEKNDGIFSAFPAAAGNPEGLMSGVQTPAGAVSTGASAAGSMLSESTDTGAAGSMTSEDTGAATAGSQKEVYEEITLEQISPDFLTRDSRKRYKIIGQLFKTYWMIEFEDKLFIIDQHAAHEKVLFERTMKKLKDKEYTSQTISPPIIMSLDAHETEMLEKYRTQIEQMGYEVEPFGGKEYMISAVPANMFNLDMKDLFIEMLDDFANLSGRDTPDLILEKVASMSCKAAVKGNDALSLPEIDALIDELLSLDNPYNCPHGRPTIISMTKYEIEKKFKRIV